MKEQWQTVNGNNTGPHHITMSGWISCAPFERLLRMEIVAAADGRATLTMPFLHPYAQGSGLLHGGALVSLADTAVVMAIKSMVPPQTRFATSQLSSTFLRPVTKGIVTAKAEVITWEKRKIEGKATVFDDDHTPVLTFSATFIIAKDDPVMSSQDESS